MSLKIGVYWAPGHGRPTDLEYIRALQPPMVRILDPDPEHARQAHAAAPHTRLALRWWELDDDNGRAKARLYAEPVAAAKDLANRYAGLVNGMVETTGIDRGLFVVGAWNEPETWDHAKRAAIAEGNRVLALELAERQIACALGELAVGHPEEWPPVWDWFAPAAAAIAQYPRHMLSLHEYWQPEGPFHGQDWGALAGRHLHCPFDVPLLIGECGVDGAIYGRAEHNTGWAHYMVPDAYAGQLVRYAAAVHARVVAVLPFMTDFRDRAWASFDTGPAHASILATLAAQPAPQPPPTPQGPPIQVFIPNIQATTPATPPVAPTSAEGQSGDNTSDRHPLGDWLVERLAGLLQIEPRVAHAFFNVESGGITRVPRPVIRFEPHIFWRRITPELHPAFVAAFQMRGNAASDPAGHYFNDHLDGQWKKIHVDQDREYRAFVLAWKINQQAAYESTSAGAGQIMGFNFAKVGYASAEAMFKAFGDLTSGQLAQIVAFFMFVQQTPGLLAACRAKDWAEMARLYNGAASYAEILANAYHRLGG